jgi:hypothetical protein
MDAIELKDTVTDELDEFVKTVSESYDAKTQTLYE